jgi:hypothetical protein
VGLLFTNNKDYVISYNAGKVLAFDAHGGDTESYAIGHVEVDMEEKSNELGIRVIVRCAIFDKANNLICNNNELISECEFNYSNGCADEEVIEYLSNQLQVDKAIIHIIY